MAKEEIPVLQKEQADLEEKIKILLLPKDPNDDKNVFLEIRAAPAAAKPVYLWVIYFACTPDMPNPRGGGWKLSVHLLRAVWAVLRKLSPRLMAGAHTAA